MNLVTSYLHNEISVPAEEIEMINGNYKGKDIISLDQFSVDDLRILFRLVNKMKQIVLNHEPSYILAGTIVSLLFFEPSSRTFSSFAAAVKRLGGQTIEIQDPETVTSVNKGESFEDTIRTFEAYSDAIVLRHRNVGSAEQAARVATSIPVINAGDGNNEHPTQTLLDLYTLYERPDFYCLSEHGIKIIEIHHKNDIPENCDLWYWTRIQKERFDSLEEYLEAMNNGFMVTPELLQRHASKDMILMDPLPRVGTIDPAVDADERAIYFRSQIRNGLYTRMALLALLLGKAEMNA